MSDSWLTKKLDKTYDDGYHNGIDDCIYEIEQIALNYLESKLFTRIYEKLERLK